MQWASQTKTSKVFTNDDLPSNSTPTSVASGPAAPAGKSVESAPGKAAANDEKMWRAKFARLNHKLEQDQSELDILQRNLAYSIRSITAEILSCEGTAAGTVPAGD